MAGDLAVRQLHAPHREVLANAGEVSDRRFEHVADTTGSREDARPVQQINVLGTELQPCSLEPVTGYYRTGCCENRGDDPGMHVVCCRVTDDFLEFSKESGNDLSTPMPQYGFAGLSDGDQWCVCAARWAEALEAGRACPVVLESTHVSALEFVDLDDLRIHAASG